MIPLPFAQPAAKPVPASSPGRAPEPPAKQGSSSKDARPFSAVMAQQDSARSSSGAKGESQSAGASDLSEDGTLDAETDDTSAAVETSQEDQQDAAADDLDPADTFTADIDTFVLEDPDDSPPDALALAAAVADGVEKAGVEKLGTEKIAQQRADQPAGGPLAKTTTIAQMRIEGWMPSAAGQPAAATTAVPALASGGIADPIVDELATKDLLQVPLQGRTQQGGIPGLAADAAKTAAAAAQQAMVTQPGQTGLDPAMDATGDAALELGAEKRARRQLLASEISATPTAADPAGKINVPPAPPPAVALAALQNAQTQSQPFSETEKSAEPLAGLAASERSVVSGQSQTATAAPVTAGAETARQVAGQIAVAINAQAGKPTEIALNPRELGRVRLTMSAIDQSITLTVVADRPETSDLMRRHIDVLAQEFRALGYNDISFAFGDQSSDGTAPTDRDTPESHSANNGTSDPNDTDLPVQQLVTQQTGLDLRL